MGLVVPHRQEMHSGLSGYATGLLKCSLATGTMAGNSEPQSTEFLLAMCSSEHRHTHPRHLAVKESMEYMLIGQYGVTGHTVQECLQHALPPSYHRSIFLGFRLFDRIVAYCLFGWDRGYDECRVELDQVLS